MAAAGHAGDPRPRAARRAARHDPAVPDLLRDLRRRAQGAPRRDRRRAPPRRCGMSTTTTVSETQGRQELLGQTVVVIGGSAGIGLETARRARAEGADVVLTGRNPERLHAGRRRARRAEHGGVRRHRLRRVSSGSSQELPGPIDHVMVTAGGPVLRAARRDGLRRGAPRRRGAPLAAAPGRPSRRRQGAARRHAAVHRRHRRPASGCRPRSSRRSPRRCRRWSANLALELAPVRVNLIAAGFVDTPLSASLLGDELDERRERAPRDAADRARRRAGRRRRARRPPHDEHRAHRRDLRHRRRPAARPG